MKKETKTPFLRSGLAFAAALLLLSGCGTKENPTPSSSEARTSSSITSEEASTAASSKQESSEESELPPSSESTVSTIPHVHTYEEGWHFDETHHWHAATCGHEEAKSAYAPHDFDEGTITKAPTYEEEGIKAFTCATCNMIKTVAIPTLVGFFMPIQDSFNITGKGLVLTGLIESGSVKVNDVLSLSGAFKKVTIKKIEKNKKNYESAGKGEEVGLLVEGVAKSEVAKGAALFTPNSKSYHNQIKVHLTSLTKDEGGFNTPFFSKYSPVVKYYPCTSGGTKGYLGEVKGCVILPEDLEMFGSGETHEVTIILKEKTLLSKGMEIALMEGGTNRAYGTITALEEHKHDARYDEIGQCSVCGFDQYKTFEYGAEIDVYSCAINLEVNESVFFKITPKSPNSEKEWTVDLSVSYMFYESEIYDVDGKPLEDSMKTGGTYIIQIIGKENINDVLVKVQDVNDM